MNPSVAKDRQKERVCLVILASAVMFVLGGRAWGVSPTPEELETAKRFAAEKLLSVDPANLPFSFVYGGLPSSAPILRQRRPAPLSGPAGPAAPGRRTAAGRCVVHGLRRHQLSRDRGVRRCP